MNDRYMYVGPTPYNNPKGKQELKQTTAPQRPKSRWILQSHYAERIGPDQFEPVPHLASISSRSLRLCFPFKPMIGSDTAQIMTPWKINALCMLRGGLAFGPALKADSAVGVCWS